MPNYCTNSLIVTGKAKHVEKFDKDFKTPSTNYVNRHMFRNLKLIDFICQTLRYDKKLFTKYEKFVSSKKFKDCIDNNRLTKYFNSLDMFQSNFKKITDPVDIIRWLVSETNMLFYKKFYKDILGDKYCEFNANNDFNDINIIIDKLFDILIKSHKSRKTYSPVKPIVKRYSMKNIIQPTELELYRDNAFESINLPYAISDWYYWENKKQGCKWDVIDLYATKSGDGEKIEYYFDSAWNSPYEFIKYISSKYNKLTFDFVYNEPGMQFAGKKVIKNGKVIEDEYYEFDNYVDYYYYVNEGDITNKDFAYELSCLYEDYSDSITALSNSQLSIEDKYSIQQNLRKEFGIRKIKIKKRFR